VGFPGLDSGFDSDLAATTDATGAFSISNVPPHTYPVLLISGGGYEPAGIKNFKVTGDVALTVKMTRDWASTEGGAKVEAFTPPDYSPFCGPDFAFDLNLQFGWGSDAVGSTSGSREKGPRSVIVKLPRAVTVSNFALASGGTCGDGPRAGVKGFQIQTRTNNGKWITAFAGSVDNDYALHTFKPKAGTKNVRFVRLTMRSNHGDKLFMDVLELSVQGR
jgi:hypothetical protein